MLSSCSFTSYNRFQLQVGQLELLTPQEQQQLPQLILQTGAYHKLKVLRVSQVTAIGDKSGWDTSELILYDIYLLKG